MAEPILAEEPKRVPGRYVVYFVVFFAFLVAIFASWGIKVMRKLPPEAYRSMPAPQK
ncbi:MAG: hypothetical protein INH43_03325 [Acidobacteriaceae bacterium]|jgi:hypothetical protein|nr:hypothetical protein [Acidobacteriaceae bacterium]